MYNHSKTKSRVYNKDIRRTHGVFSNNYFNFSRISAALTPSAISF